MHQPRRIILDHRAAAGDTVVLTAAIKALHESQPGQFLTDFVGHHGRVAPPGNNLVAHNPYITALDPATSEYVNLDYGYGLSGSEWGGGCGRSYHFLHAFVEDLVRKLGVHIELRDFRGDIWLSQDEREPWPGLMEPYAVIDAGIKRDFTAKGWSAHRYQQVVNATRGRIQWVQIGAAGDIHPVLENVVNLVGRTSLRDLCRIVHRASLVLTPVSLPMHLAAAVPTPADGPKLPPLPIDAWHERHAMRRLNIAVTERSYSGKIRPCVVIGGQREQRQWEQYPGHTWLGADRRLSCGVGPGEGCWRNKTVHLPGDGDESICFKPLTDEVGAWVPECLHQVSVEECGAAVERWL